RRRTPGVAGWQGEGQSIEETWIGLHGAGRGPGRPELLWSGMDCVRDRDGLPATERTRRRGAFGTIPGDRRRPVVRPPPEPRPGSRRSAAPGRDDDKRLAWSRRDAPP